MVVALLLPAFAIWGREVPLVFVLGEHLLELPEQTG
jgi:hypothetical protein